MPQPVSPHKTAFLNRQAGSFEMKDGLVETAGLPDDGDAEETAEILADADTMAAIAEGEADLANGDVEPFDPSDHTVDEVNAYLENADDAEIERVWEIEVAGKARVGILGEDED